MGKLARNETGASRAREIEGRSVLEAMCNCAAGKRMLLRDTVVDDSSGP